MAARSATPRITHPPWLRELTQEHALPADGGPSKLIHHSPCPFGSLSLGAGKRGSSAFFTTTAFFLRILESSFFLIFFCQLGVSENREPQKRTLNCRILIIRTPKQGTPYFQKLPFCPGRRCSSVQGAMSATLGKVPCRALGPIQIRKHGEIVGPADHFSRV